MYSKTKSKVIIKNVTIQILNTNFWSCLLEFSKNILIDKANNINLTKPKVLTKLLSIFELKIRLIKKEAHKNNNIIKNLFLNILKFFSLNKKIINIIHANIVFKLIKKLPNKKQRGNIEIIKPRKINNFSSFKFISVFCKIIFDYFF